MLKHYGTLMMFTPLLVTTCLVADESNKGSSPKPTSSAALLINNVQEKYTAPIGKTALHYAVQKGDANKVKELLHEGGFDINSKEPVNGYAALHLAVQSGFKTITELLIRAGAHVNQSSHEPVNPYPIHMATVGNHKEILEHLIFAKADVNVRSMVGGRTALHKAARMGLHAIVVTLVKTGKADTNMRDNHNKTALDIANENNWHEIVRFLARYTGHRVNDDVEIEDEEDTLAKEEHYEQVS
jgi:ankyrin repeat protein